MIMGLFTGCFLKKSAPAKGNVVRFYYAYNGSIGGDSYSYTVKKEDDGKYYFTYESMLYDDFDEMKVEVDQQFMDYLSLSYELLELGKWNGFDKVAKNILDGDGFSLNITLEDGNTVSAHGSNAYPKGYSQAIKSIDETFEPLVTQLVRQEYDKIIAKGINSEISSILISFIQHGDSGRDSYHILVTKEGIRDNNFDVQIKNLSGENYKQGEYRYYQSVENKDLRFDTVLDIIKECNVLHWVGFDETDPDYNNKEWFQISINFEDDLNISAMGTAHPENYDQFREAILNWLSDVTEDMPVNN